MFEYDTEEVQRDAERLLEKMTGRRCQSMLAMLSYVDEEDESGCKIIMKLVAKSPRDVGRMIGSSVINLTHLISKMDRDIRAQFGDEIAEDFLKALQEDVEKRRDSDHQRLKQMTQIMTEKLKGWKKGGCCPRCGAPLKNERVADEYWDEYECGSKAYPSSDVFVPGWACNKIASMSKKGRRRAR